MKARLYLFLCFQVLLCFKTAHAVSLTEDFDLDINVALISDYRDKGISQSRGDPALQAGATIQAPFGLYVGAWVSSVNFGSGVNTRLERDYFAGWFIPLSDDLSLDVGWLKYDYVSSSYLNSTTWYGLLRYKGFELGYQYSGDRAGDQSGDYTALKYTYALNDSTDIDVRLGVVDAKDKVILSGGESLRSKYREWEFGASKTIFGATWRLALIDTDLSKSECSSISEYNDVCSATFVVSASKNF